MSVSIIIPMFNSEKTIEKSINSILYQTFTDWELILVDDGSTDSTTEICQSFCNRDARIRIIKGDHKGVSAARNIGIKESKYPLIAFNDSDDQWKADKLEKQIEKINSEDFGLVYSRYTYISKTLKKYVPAQYLEDYLLEGNIYDSLWKSNKIGTPTIMVKRSVIKSVGGFSESIHSLEDWEFVLRVSSEYKIGFIPESLVDADYVKEGGVNASFDEQVATMKYLLALYPNSDKKIRYQNIASIYNKISLCKKNEIDQEWLNNSDWKNAKLKNDEGNKNVNHILSDIVNGTWWEKNIKKYNFRRDSKLAIFGVTTIGLELLKNKTKIDNPIVCFYDTNVFFVNGSLVKKPFIDIDKIDIIINTSKNIDLNMDDRLKGKLIINIYEI